MSDSTGNQEIVAAILTSAVLRQNPKPHAKIAVETYRNVLEQLRLEMRAKPEAPPAVAEAAPSTEAAAEG